MIDVILWYIWIQAFALGGSLLARHWLSNLPDQGYGVGKALGILLAAYAYWLFVNLGWAQNNIGAVLMALATVWVAGIASAKWKVGSGQRAEGKEQNAEVISHKSGDLVSDAPVESKRVPPTGLMTHDFMARDFRLILTTEILFALAFAVCALFRAYTPDIVSAGGEKFMESLMLNAILRSTHFPPNDAWLSGFAISYYYFGYIMQAMLTIASGIRPSIAFNLSGAMTFALTATSAFSVGFNLWSVGRRARSDERGALGEGREANESPHALRSTPHGSRLTPYAIAAGLLTAAMLCIMGNMGGLMGALKCVNALPQSVWQWLDVYQTANRTFTCDLGFIPRTDFYSWWWDWARVVKDYLPNGQPWDMITESPIFSFVLGDNHPHVLALPFVLLAVAMAINFATQRDQRSELAQDPTPAPTLIARISSLIPHTSYLSILLAAIVVGGLSFLNTWDFPVYGSLVIGGLLLGAMQKPNPQSPPNSQRFASVLNSQLLPAAIQGALIMLLGYVLYLPFYSTFSSQARGIGINLFNATRLPQFALMFAPFLVIAIGYGWQQLRTSPTPRAALIRQITAFVGIVIAGCVLVVLLFGLVSRPGRELLNELQSTGQVLGIPRDQLSQKLVERASNPWTAILLIGFAAIAATQIYMSLVETRGKRVSRSRVSADDDPNMPADTYPSMIDTHPPTETRLLRVSTTNAHIIVAALFGAGAVLTLAPEFIFLQDLFGNRMNTVFKFYYQAWTLWSVAGAFALLSLWASARKSDRVFAILGSAVVAAGLLWVLMAPLSKTNQFAAKPTLDGAAYLQNSNTDDAAAIDWLNQNVRGDPVIVEGNKKGAGYDYIGRISAFTGLPAVLGWGGHENQWRGNYDEPGKREPLIEQLYNTTDPIETRNILAQFNVRYVIVGETERNQYTPEGLSKFDQLCGTAFKKGNTVIYACQ